MSFTFEKKTNGKKNKLIASIQKKKGIETDIYLNLDKTDNKIDNIISNGDKIIPIIDKTLRSDVNLKQSR